MKHTFFILLLISALFGSLLVNQDKFPQLFSKQDPINPNNLSENYDPNAKIAIFDNHQIPIPKFNPLKSEVSVLGESDPSNKRIEVDLTNQRLYAFEGDKMIHNFLISSGKWDRTPNGNFKIWTKIRSAKMSGGSKELGTYYYLPNVPYIMYFYNDQHPKSAGFSLHGTYWHHNFGTPMSHGCINMYTPDAETIFSWAEINTPITIYGKYQYKLSNK